MPTVAAELLFKSVIGSRQVGVLIAVEEARPVAAGDFDKVTDGILQIAGILLMMRHGSEKAAESPLNVTSWIALWIIQDLRRLMYPGKRSLHARP